MLGGFAQKKLGRIFGMGEYKQALANEIGSEPDAIRESNAPEVNSLVAPLSTNDLVPLMHHDSEGTIRITRREFIGTVDIRTSGSTQRYIIEPGNAVAFPWLNTLAKNFQQYAFLGLAAEYVPTSGFAVGNDVGNAALGQVAMAYKYNVTEDPGAWPVSDLAGILNMNGSVSGSPAAPSSCYMECDPSMTNQPVKYVKTDETLANYSDQNYDSAILIVRTEGAQDPFPFQCGQLWFTYEIALFNPRPQDPALLLDDEYSELLRELHYLQEYAGPMSDRELYRLDFRERELVAFTRSLEFIQKRGKLVLRRRIERLDEEKKLAPVSPYVLALLDEESEAQRQRRDPINLGEVGIDTPAPPPSTQADPSYVSVRSNVMAYPK
jgi:hypothetical protein